MRVHGGGGLFSLNASSGSRHWPTVGENLCHGETSPSVKYTAVCVQARPKDRT